MSSSITAEAGYCKFVFDTKGDAAVVASVASLPSTALKSSRLSGVHSEDVTS